MLFSGNVIDAGIEFAEQRIIKMIVGEVEFFRFYNSFGFAIGF